MNERVPLHVLTGFLGSGKTTVLAELLRDPRAGRIAALVNEVGDLPLDQHLLERVDEDVLALPSGCVCCTLRGELHAAVARVAAFAPEHLVLETTGIAAPAPIVDGLASDPVLARLVRPGAVIAVVDCLRFEDLLESEPEVRAQLDLADRVVLTKVDLAPQREDGVRALLAAEAPGREVRAAPGGRVDATWLLGAAPLARLTDLPTARAWLAHDAGAPGAHGVRTHAVDLPAPADVDVLQLWLRLVTQLDAPRLLRIKALVECRASGAVYALQAAGRAISPPRRLARPPTGVRGVRAVIVERGLPPAAAARLLDSLREAAAAG